MGIKFCSLFSGSSGNCQYIKTENSTVIVDAGLSGKRIQQGIVDIGEKPENIHAIFITHEHVDHIKGAGIMSRKYDIPIYANEKTWAAMEKSLGKIKPENIKLLEDGVEIGDMFIQPFDISHDAAAPVGYKIFHENKKISLLTDTGCVTQSIKENIKNSDLLLIESNHDEDMVLIGPYPWPLKQRVLGEFGHMSNTTCGRLLADVLSKGNETVLLGHLSKENNFPELAYKTVENILREKGIDCKNDIRLNMTFRDKCTMLYEV